MRNQLLVIATGEDRPGIVARLSEVFVKHGANVEESRMANLGGEFAAIALITIPLEKVSGLQNELKTLADETISVTTKPTRPIDPQRFSSFTSFHITLSGADHEGIVHRVSAYLRDHAINIQSMETEVVHAPVTGMPLFQMKAYVMAPPSISLSDLQAQLRAIGNEESVEISVEPVNQQKTAAGTSNKR